MARVQGIVRRHPVGSFIVLAWGLSWAYWIPMAIRGEIATPGGSVSHFPGLLGPLVAAVIVTALAEGRVGLRAFWSRLVRWRVPLRWYLVAIIPFLVFMAAVVLLVVIGGDVPAISELGEFSGLPVLAFPAVALLVLFVNGYGEEAGWRGFLTTHLLERHGLLTTSLFVAGAWFVWHVPAFWVVETYRNLGLGIVPMMGIGLISGAIVTTWVYVGSGSSVLIVALWHMALNFASATMAARGLPGVIVWNGMLLWAILVTIGWIVAPEPTSRPFLTRLRDGSLIGILRSPFGRLFGGMTVVTFRARRSGRTLMTPVECVYEPGQVFILVGHPDHKQWWRNVQADPNVAIAIAGRDVPGRATVHVGDDPEAVRDLLTYIEHRPRAARAVGLPTDRSMDPSALAAAAERAVSVRIDLLQPLSAG